MTVSINPYVGALRGSGSAGGGDVTSAQLAASLATKADLGTLTTGQAAQDAVIAAKASQADVTTLQGQMADDELIESMIREPDNSLTATLRKTIDNTTRTVSIAAAAAVDISGKADQVDLDAHVNDAAQHSDTIYDDTAIAAALAAEVATRAADDTLEIAARTAADLLDEKLANKVTGIRADGVAGDTEYPTEKAVRDLFGSLVFAGEWADSAATYAALPTTRPETDPLQSGDRSVLTLDDIGTGDAQNPQYPSGIYQYNGTSWQLLLRIQSPVGGAYIRATNGQTLEVGKRYLANTGTVNTPPVPADGDWFYIRNDSDWLSVAGTDLDRVTLIGPLRTGDAQDLPGFALAPGIELLAVFDAGTGRWKSAFMFQQIATLQNVHAGREVRSGVDYLIQASDPGMVFRLPATPAGQTSFRLTAGSVHPVMIEQFDMGATQQLRLEDNTVINTFEIPLSASGRKVEVSGDPFANRWHIYRDWEQLSEFDTLEDVRINVSSNGTNAGSLVNISFTDRDGNAYPNSDWRVTAALTGGNTVTLNDAVWTGSLVIGRNINVGPLIFTYVGSHPNGFSAITSSAANSAQVREVLINFEGTNQHLDYATTSLVGIVDWTTNQAQIIDSAAPWSTAKDYTTDQNLPFAITLPATDASGDYVFGSGETGSVGKTYNAFYTSDRTAAASVAAIADDAATVAEIALMTLIGEVSPPAILLGRLAPVAKVVSAPTPMPSTEAANSRLLYLGATTSDIYQYDNVGADPVAVTDPGSAEWQTGVLVRDNATGNDYVYDRATNRFVAAPSSAGGLRGEPVADAAALTALTAKDYEKRKTLDTDTDWVFELGRTPAASDLADDAATGAWVEQAPQPYDETSVAEYRVAWGGANGGSNANSSSPYYAIDDTITLEHDGDYTFDVLPYQTTLSQENGTATGGIFYLKTSTGSTLEALTFPWKKRDSNYTNFPYEGGRQTIYRANMTAGTYRLGFTSHAGSGSGNRVSYNGYAHVIVRRSSLKPTSVFPATPQTLVVTSPTATPDIVITEEQAGFYSANVTAGQQLVLGATADVTISLVNPEAGLFTAQATGPNPTVTFTEVAAPAATAVNIDYMPGDNVEFEITGKLFGGKQVYGRSFDRNVTFSGSDYTWMTGILDDPLGIHGLLPSDWGSTAITGSTSSSGSTDGTYDIVFRKVGNNLTSRTDRSMGSRPIKFWVEYTKV